MTFFWSPSAQTPVCCQRCQTKKEVLALKAELDDEEQDALRMIASFCSIQVREQAFAMSQQDRVLLWKDGACTNTQVRQLMRAGVWDFLLH